MADFTLPAGTQKGEKKKPGRPRKKIAESSVESHGIVKEAVNQDDILELVYCNPLLFKKIFQMFKAFGVGDIEMNFDPAGLKIITKDHLGKSTIITAIDGKYMNLYYCKSQVRVCVRREDLDSVLGTLGKQHHKVTFILKENYRSTLYLIVKDADYNNDDAYEVDVVFKPEDPNILLVREDDANYPIKFRVASKHFKNRIANISKLSPTFTIQKCGLEPLQLTYDKVQKVNWTGVYSDSEKIGLRSSLTKEDIFSVSVYIDYIKPLASSNVGDVIFIAVDKKEKISFSTRLDEKGDGCAALIKIFTEIKDYYKV